MSEAPMAVQDWARDRLRTMYGRRAQVAAQLGRLDMEIDALKNIIDGGDERGRTDEAPTCHGHNAADKRPAGEAPNGTAGHVSPAIGWVRRVVNQISGAA